MRPAPMFVALAAAAQKRKYPDSKMDATMAAAEKIAKF